MQSNVRLIHNFRKVHAHDSPLGLGRCIWWGYAAAGSIGETWDRLALTFAHRPLSTQQKQWHFAELLVAVAAAASVDVVDSLRVEDAVEWELLSDPQTLLLKWENLFTTAKTRCSANR